MSSNVPDISKEKCGNPDCMDGMLPIHVTRMGIGIGCCGEFRPSGECCGNAIPVPEPYQDIDWEPCPHCNQPSNVIVGVSDD